jgi:hypothetical protein
VNSVGILEQSVGARNRVGIGLSYLTARLHRLAELIPWNRFLGSLKVAGIVVTPFHEVFGYEFKFCHCTMKPYCFIVIAKQIMKYRYSETTAVNYF